MPPRKKTQQPEPRLFMSPAGRAARLDGQDVDRVTNILNALPKQLTQWASDQAANYAVEHWDELTEETLTKRLDKIRFAHRDTLNRAQVRGTQIHHYGEQLVTGADVPVPDELLGPAEAYARFLDTWKIEPLAIETPVAHTDYRYAGRADLWAKIGARAGATALIDLKTGSGVYESTVMQLAAYRHASIWQPNGPESESPLPSVDLVYVAHIGPDDVRMLPVTAGPEEFRAFLYVQQTALWLKAHAFKGDEPLIGPAAHPDRPDWSEF